LRRADLGRHRRDLGLDQLVVGDRLAEGLPLARVADRVLERRVGDAQTARRDIYATQLDAGHELPEPLPNLAGAAEDARGRRAEPLKDELGGLDALIAELFQWRGNRQSRLLGDPGLFL